MYAEYGQPRGRGGLEDLGVEGGISTLATLTARL